MTRGESKRAIRAINIFGAEIYRVQASMPFCVDSLSVSVRSHGRFRSSLIFSSLGRAFLDHRERRGGVRPHLVEWRHRPDGSVAASTRWGVLLQSGPIPAGAHCPRIRLRVFGNAHARGTGHATGCPQ